MKSEIGNRKSAILLLVISCLVFYSGCKEDVEGLGTDYRVFQSSAALTCDEIVDVNLNWIARGVAKVADDRAFVDNLELLMTQNDFGEVKHSTASTELWTSMSLNYANEVKQEIINRFPNNTYDDTYFSQFVCDSCNYSTVIYSPNIFGSGIANDTIFVTWITEEASDKDTMKAYFSTGTGLDSINITEDFLDTKRLWVITAYSDCKTGLSTGVSELQYKRGPCNNNNNCDDELGETPTNCTDCGEDPNANSLYLLSYKMTTDNKNGSTHPEDKYQEGWVRNRYEIAMQYRIIVPVTAGATTIYNHSTSFCLTTDLSGRLLNSVGAMFVDTLYGRSTEAGDALFQLDKLKVGRGNSDVKRCNLSNNDCSGINVPKDEHVLMSTAYQPHHIVYLIMYERDKRSWHDKNWISNEDVNFTGVTNPFKINMRFRSQHPPFTFNNGDYAMKIDNTLNWQQEDINGISYQTVVLQLDGEMEIKLGYKAN